MISIIGHPLIREGRGKYFGSKNARKSSQILHDLLCDNMDILMVDEPAVKTITFSISSARWAVDISLYLDQPCPV